MQFGWDTHVMVAPSNTALVRGPAPSSVEYGYFYSAIKQDATLRPHVMHPHGIGKFWGQSPLSLEVAAKLTLGL